MMKAAQCSHVHFHVQHFQWSGNYYKITNGDSCQWHKAWQNRKDEGRHTGMNPRMIWVTLQGGPINSDYYKRPLS